MCRRSRGGQLHVFLNGEKYHAVTENISDEMINRLKRGAIMYRRLKSSRGSNVREFSFRELDRHYLLIKDISLKTKMQIQNAGFPLCLDDNAALVYGYVDHDEGINFELLCAARVFSNGSMTLEQGNPQRSARIPYEPLEGWIEPFTDSSLVAPFKAKEKRIMAKYYQDEGINELREIPELDASRAEGRPDVISVYFIKDGVHTEQVCCKAEGYDPAENKVLVKLLHEPRESVLKHMGDMVEARLVRVSPTEARVTAFFDMDEILGYCIG